MAEPTFKVLQEIKNKKNGEAILLQNLTLQYSSKLHDISNHKVLRLHEMLK